MSTLQIHEKPWQFLTQTKTDFMLWGCSQWGHEHSSPLLARSPPSNCWHLTYTPIQPVSKKWKRWGKSHCNVNKTGRERDSRQLFLCDGSQMPMHGREGLLKQPVKQEQHQGDVALGGVCTGGTAFVQRWGLETNTAYSLPLKRKALSVKINFLTRPLKS